MLAAALVETALVSWRDLKQEKIPPPPSDYVAIALIYGGLALFPESASTFTSLFGWGLVIATFLDFWSPQAPTSLGGQRQQNINQAYAPNQPGSLFNVNPPPAPAPGSGIPSSGGGFVAP